MDAALAPYFERLKDHYSEESFEARVRELDESFGGLLDPEAIGLFLLDEHGLNDGAVVTLADCRGRPEATVLVRVTGVHPPREFQREGGTGRVLNVDVADASGEARLTLWDRDVEKAEDGTLAAGAVVKVVNARVRDSRFGLELHVTPWTALEVEGALDPAKRKLLTDTLPDGAPPARVAPAPASAPGGARQARLDALPAAEEGASLITPRPPPPPPEPIPLGDVRDGDTVQLVRARLVRLEPTRPFRRKDGTTGFMAKMEVEDDTGRLLVTLWDDAIKAARDLQEGDPVELTDLAARTWSGSVELSTTRASRVARAE